jgi:F420-non-reducing hydrogenase iron-sulfur subunit
MRLDYPTNIKVIKVPCSGRVDSLTLLKAVESGVDGVCVIGCMEGECHFIKGNLRAKKRVRYAKEILEEVGLDPGRVEMFHVSAADGQGFAVIARKITAQIQALGPSPLRKEIKPSSSRSLPESC